MYIWLCRIYLDSSEPVSSHQTVSDQIFSFNIKRIIIAVLRVDFRVRDRLRPEQSILTLTLDEMVR